MGHRANLIVVKNNNSDLYYSHWGALTLGANLFWGPRHTLSYIRSQQPRDKNQWSAIAEGGALMDLDRKILLWYMEWFSIDEVLHREEFLKLMRAVWKGWEVRWAYDGMTELAACAGVSRDDLADKYHMFNILEIPVREPGKDGDPKSFSTILTLRDLNGKMRIVPLFYSIPAYLEKGPQIMEELLALPDQEELQVGDSATGGFHLDVQEKQLSFWYSYARPNDREEVAKRWSGWQVTSNYNCFRWQEEMTGHRLAIASDERREFILKRIIQSRLHGNPVSPLAFFSKSVDLMRKEGKKVTVNPDALVDARLTLTLKQRRRLLRAALRQVSPQLLPLVEEKPLFSRIWDWLYTNSIKI